MQPHLEAYIIYVIIKISEAYHGVTSVNDQ